MRRVFLLTMAAAVLLHAADVGGRWDGPTEMKNGNGEPVVVHLLLKQDGNRISGDVWTEDHDEDNPKPIQNGSVDGAKVRFDVPQNGNAVVAFELELKTDTLDGTAKFQGPNGPQTIQISFKRKAAR